MFMNQLHGSWHRCEVPACEPLEIGLELLSLRRSPASAHLHGLWLLTSTHPGSPGSTRLPNFGPAGCLILTKSAALRG